MKYDSDSVPQDIYRQRLYIAYKTSMRNGPAPSMKASRGSDPYLCRLISIYFPKERTIKGVDLGCGSGQLVSLARQFGYNDFFGIDRSPECVNIARMSGNNFVYQEEIGLHLQGAAPNSYDLVVTFDVIEHLTKCEFIEVIDGIYRALKPGGLWLIHAPNGTGFFGVHSFYGDFTHENAYSASSLAQVLRASKFTSISSFSDMPIPHGIVSFMRRICWTVIEAVLRFALMAESGVYSGVILTSNFLTIAKKGENL